MFRFKIPLKVQDRTGSVSLTLFDRDANKLLKKTANELCERMLEIGDMDMYPRELDDLVGKKFAFRVEITPFNINKNVHVYSICNLTNDENILTELESKDAVDKPAESESMNSLFINGSQGTFSLKDAVSHTADNNTPATVEKSTTSSPDFKPKIEKSTTTSPSPSLKRKLEDAYEDDVEANLSTTKTKIPNKNINNYHLKKKPDISACDMKIVDPKKED